MQTNLEMFSEVLSETRDHNLRVIQSLKPSVTNTLALPLLQLKEFDRPSSNVLIDTVSSWLDRLGLEMMI